MKLFAIYIGGDHPNANIELHDMRFVVAESLEATHPALHAQWWGTSKSLHIDCWAELSQADGYRIALKPEPFLGPERLFYVNLGGYEPQQFTELHQNVFVVAETESKAKVKALKGVRHWNSFHKDDMYEAEQCFALDAAAAEQRLHIHLTKIDDAAPPPFICGYFPIGKAA